MATIAGAFATFGRNDLRTIRHDSLMVMLGPFLYALALWLLPAVTNHVAQQWAFDLAPYHSAIMRVLRARPITAARRCAGVQLLDERDQNTLAALRVTPVPPATYPAYRAALATVLSTLTVIAALAVSGQVPAATLALSVPVAVVPGLLTPVPGLVMNSLGRTKIEGLAVMRVVGWPCLPCRSSRSSSSTRPGSWRSGWCSRTGR